MAGNASRPVVKRADADNRVNAWSIGKPDELVDHGSIIVRAIIPPRLVARYLWSRVMRIVSHFHPGRDGFVTPPTKKTPDDGWGSSAWWGVYSAHVVFARGIDLSHRFSPTWAKYCPASPTV